MDEKYYLYDLLSSEKSMTVNMSIALNEASTDNLYKKYLQMFKNVSSAAKDLYYFAYKNNWYNLENAQEDKISEKITNMTDEIKNNS